MKKKRLSLLVAGIVVLLLLLMVQSADEDVNSKVDLGWYKVADWEVEVCRKWGGLYDEESAASGQTLAKNMSAYTSMTLTATIQGGILEVSPGEGTFPNNTQVYEISWYVQPIAESLNYDVTAFYKDGNTKLIESTSATPYSGYDGYHAEESTKKMTHVALRVPSKNINLKVPFIENGK
jgi:hypothetical protein